MPSSTASRSGRRPPLRCRIRETAIPFRIPTEATTTISHSLIVLPDDTAKPILDAVTGAARSLNIRMFLFTDPTLIEAVLAAKRRGVKVRVMLNPARRDGKAERHHPAARRALKFSAHTAAA